MPAPEHGSNASHCSAKCIGCYIDVACSVGKLLVGWLMREVITGNQHSLVDNTLFRICLNCPAAFWRSGPRYPADSLLWCYLRRCMPLLFLPSCHQPSQLVSFAMNNYEDSPQYSRPSSPLDLQENSPHHRSSPGSSPTPPTPIPPTLPECPMTEWIRQHPCWQSNASFTRTEETADADSWNNPYLASLVPTMGFIHDDMTFLQHLGFLSDLRERQSCNLCQKTYQYIMAESIGEEYKENNTTVDEREISCSIFQEDAGHFWFRISVSTSFHICIVISDAKISMQHLARGNAEFFMRRIRGHKTTICYP
jgi:hypothetical protein